MFIYSTYLRIYMYIYIYMQFPFVLLLFVRIAMVKCSMLSQILKWTWIRLTYRKSNRHCSSLNSVRGHPCTL